MGTPQKLDSILKMSRETIGTNTINKRQKAAASKAAVEDGDEDAEENDEDDDDEMQHVDGRKSTKIDNRKSKIIKKPAAAIMKKPSMAAPGGKPDPSFEPTTYRSGRIYFARTQNRFRIYCRPGDKHEKSVKYDRASGNKKLLKEAWAKALKFIDDDERPM